MYKHIAAGHCVASNSKEVGCHQSCHWSCTDVKKKFMKEVFSQCMADWEEDGRYIVKYKYKYPEEDCTYCTLTYVHLSYV